MPIQEVDLTIIRDGSYQGTFADHGFLWQLFGRCYKVETAFRDHRIVSIKVLGNYNKGAVEKAKKVLQQVVEQQRLNVDPVPNTVKASKCLLKAVENSLTQSGQ